MSFKSLVDGILNLRDYNGSENYNWTVEVFFADPEDPKLGSYATIGVYTNKKDAENRQEFLANYCKHEFLIFRIRKFD